ncbi:MAG: iron ABC transporter permease [Treponema sp.]|jgi:thiamine transport system permease protein|nr:iron ABC transporter permease [Treponema sp.]
MEKSRKLFAIRQVFGKNNAILFVLALFPIAGSGVVFIAPYCAALGKGLAEGSGVPSSLVPIALWTTKQAFFSVLAALALGLPGAWFVGTSASKSTRTLRALSAIPFAMPSILVVLGFVLFFGNNGIVNRFFMFFTGLKEPPVRILYQTSSIILAHAFYNFPLVIRLVGDSLEKTRRLLSAPAAVLGANPLVTAVTIFLPAILPSLITASLLVFLYSFTSFAVVLVLGGGPKAGTLAVEIYRYARVSLSFRDAGVLAAAETAIALLVFGLYLFFSHKTQMSTMDSIDRPVYTPKESIFRRISFILYLGAILFLAVGPLLSVFVESFLARSSRAGSVVISLRWWIGVNKNILPAFYRSALLAVWSASSSCVLAICAAFSINALKNLAENEHGISRFRKSFWRFLGILIKVCAISPLLSSGIVLGLGFIIIYGGFFSTSPNSSGVLAVIAIHAVTVLPFTFNAVMEGFNSIPKNILSAAEVMGAHPLMRLLAVDIPMSAIHIRSAWGFAAALSLGELNAVMMLGLENFETLPLLIYRAAGAYRYGTACAAGVILILCCTGALLLTREK